MSEINWIGVAVGGIGLWLFLELAIAALKGLLRWMGRQWRGETRLSGQSLTFQVFVEAIDMREKFRSPFERKWFPALLVFNDEVSQAFFDFFAVFHGGILCARRRESV